MKKKRVPYRPPVSAQFEAVLLKLYPDAERTQDGQLAVAGPHGVLLKVTEDRLEVSLPHARVITADAEKRELQPAGFWGARRLGSFRDSAAIQKFLEPAFPEYGELPYDWERCDTCGRPLPPGEQFGGLPTDIDFCRSCFQVMSGLEPRAEL